MAALAKMDAYMKNGGTIFFDLRDDAMGLESLSGAATGATDALRRILANLADAEDAFQATFLVFVRKARSLRRGDRLSPWLYGVAVRVAVAPPGHPLAGRLLRASPSSQPARPWPSRVRRACRPGGP